MAAMSKALPPLPWKSHRSNAEVSERRRAHTLGFEKPSAHDLPVQLSSKWVWAQGCMENPEHRERPE